MSCRIRTIQFLRGLIGEVLVKLAGCTGGRSSEGPCAFVTGRVAERGMAVEARRIAKQAHPLSSSDNGGMTSAWDPAATALHDDTVKTDHDLVPDGSAQGGGGASHV